MCIFGSSTKAAPAPPTPAPARAPASLDLSDMEQTPSGQRKKQAKGKRGIRNKKTTTTGLTMGGASQPSLTIASSKKGKY